MANRLHRTLDSLFGRLALLVIVVLLLSHFAGYALFRLEGDQMQARYAVEEAVFLVDAVRQHIASTPNLPLPSRVRVVELTSATVPPLPTHTDTPFSRFLDAVRERMPPGTEVRVGKLGKAPPTLWVHQSGDRDWIVVPLQPLGELRAAGRPGPVHLGPVAGGQYHHLGNAGLLAQRAQRSQQPVLVERHLLAQRDRCGLVVDAENVECHGRVLYP